MMWLVWVAQMLSLGLFTETSTAAVAMYCNFHAHAHAPTHAAIMCLTKRFKATTCTAQSHLSAPHRSESVCALPSACRCLLGIMTLRPKSASLMSAAYASSPAVQWCSTIMRYSSTTVQLSAWGGEAV